MSQPAAVGWIVTNWRLKLLSLLLAMGLLGGVAFSQNPPTFDSVAVRVEYANLPQGLMVVNPITSIDVPVAGFRDAVQQYKQSAAGVSIDLRAAKAGAGQLYDAKPRLDVPGLTFRQGAIPISLTIEPVETRQIDIQVRTNVKSAGITTVPDQTYATCGSAATTCQVAVTGPKSVVDGLKAYVDYDVQTNAPSVGLSPNQPIKFEAGGRPIDLSRTPRTIPGIQVTPDSVTVRVVTQGGVQTKTVPVMERVQGVQACGYEITSVDVQPTQVNVTGSVDAVAGVTSVTMDPVSIAGLTAGVRTQRTVLTGSTAVTADPAQVTVVVSVIQAFACTAPTPTPSPTPKPT